MRVLLLGAGAVGEAYAVLVAKADPDGQWLDRLVVADAKAERVEEVVRRFAGDSRVVADTVDAGDRGEVEAAIVRHQADLVMNACPQHLDKIIFDACLAAGCNYMDMAMTLSEPHPDDPYRQANVLLGDYQYAQHEQWEKKGLTALLGMGVDPGVSEVFVKHAELNLFDEIDEVGIRDGANFTVEGVKYAPQFSVWSILEETSNPPLFWEADRGFYTDKPLSRPEVFDFPGGIGPLTAVAIEHEEVVNVPRWINKGLKKVDFKIALGDEFVQALHVLIDLGLTSVEAVTVDDSDVVPREVVAAVMADPAKIGHLMEGRICVGALVKGRKDGQPREVYVYQVADNKECMERFGCQAVAAQTASGSAIATELLGRGLWKKPGVLPPEAFDPAPFLALMESYGFPWAVRDSWEK